MSEYDSFRFLLSFSASFWTVFIDSGAAPPVHAKISGTKVLCSTSRYFLMVFYCFDTFMTFVGARYSFRAGFRMGVESFYIKKGSAESAYPESICLDVKFSVIFSSGCFNVKAFAFQRLKFCNSRPEVHIDGK